MNDPIFIDSIDSIQLFENSIQLFRNSIQQFESSIQLNLGGKTVVTWSNVKEPNCHSGIIVKLSQIAPKPFCSLPE
jgi:hypothetical protein